MGKLNRIWWTPLSFVIIALIALLVTPIIVERRVADVRARLTNGSDRARVLINDLEAGFASQLLRGRWNSPSDTAGVASDALLLQDERDLLSSLELVGPGAVERFASLEALLHQWQMTPHATIDDSLTVAHAREIFAAAERLDSALAVQSDEQRESARKIEAVPVDLAIALAPIALIAVVVVIWAGGRVVRYAHAAEEQRLEVVRAAEARAALLRGVTHDVKNPLSAAAGYAHLLEEGVVGELPQAQIDMVRRIRRLVEQSVDTVTDLLEVARIDSHGLAIEYAQIDVSRLVSDAVTDHVGSAAEKGVALHCDLGGTQFVVTDPRRVRQVLSNLLSNAIKYTPSGGHVSVRLSPDGSNRLGIHIVDDGPGVPPELRQRLFDEFFRVRRDGESGNGLGLAISRRIARLLGGDVDYAPVAPNGSEFTLWLPKAQT